MENKVSCLLCAHVPVCKFWIAVKDVMHHIPVKLPQMMKSSFNKTAENLAENCQAYMSPKGY